jgi:hypothetical protein
LQTLFDGLMQEYFGRGKYMTVDKGKMIDTAIFDLYRKSLISYPPEVTMRQMVIFCQAK